MSNRDLIAVWLGIAALSNPAIPKLAAFVKFLYADPSNMAFNALVSAIAGDPIGRILSLVKWWGGEAAAPAWWAGAGISF